MSLFNIDNTIDVENKTPRLAGDTIYESVVLKEVKADDITSKAGQSYKTLFLQFADENNSIHEHRFFPPSATEMLVDGTFGKQASDLAHFRFSIQHMIEALNPNLFKQIKEGKKFEIKTWDDMRKFVVKAFTPGLNNPISLKLLKDKEGYATLPKYPVGVSKEGNMYLKTRFMSNLKEGQKALVFTEKEKKAMTNTTAGASPSDMTKVSFDKKETETDFDI
jgi:hypothetical protein